MPFAASFLAQAAIQTIRPQLEKILRDQFGRATSRLTNPPASSGAPPRRSSSD